MLGPPCRAVHGLLIAITFVVEHRFKGARASAAAADAAPGLWSRLGSCVAQALLRGTWDLPGPGIEPVSPALAGGFLTPEPPGKPFFLSLDFVDSRDRDSGFQHQGLCTCSFLCLEHSKGLARSLVRELGSFMLHGAAKKKKKKAIQWAVVGSGRKNQAQVVEPGCQREWPPCWWVGKEGFFQKVMPQRFEGS